eukprot:scaffold8962_cov123-Cylindrotheca_fusiformis.AAC.1
MVEAKGSDGDDRPSSARRKHLREADANGGSVPTVSNFFQIDRYYDASEKVLETFELAFEKKLLDEAYVYGMRYCTFCVEGIAKHDYYRSEKFRRKRSIINKRVTEVLTKLEAVADFMDAEEIEKEAQRKANLKKLQEERDRRQKEKLAELQLRVNQQKRDKNRPKHSSGVGNVQESALAKLKRLNGPVEPPDATTSIMPAKLPAKKVSFHMDDQVDPDGHHANSSSLPPALLPPERDGYTNEDAPPSYQDIVNYFGPSSPETPLLPPEEQSAPSYDQIAKLPKKTPVERKLSIRQYIAQAERKRAKLQQERKILVSPLKTYQGRVGGSTNGCTVISACVASKHLETHGGVTDAHIANIIDRDCVPLLRVIRNKLDLNGSSLIIPSDVHDHMVDNNLLFQHKFVGAVGGNIINPEHIGELFTMLRGEPGKTQHLKAAATFFFREHVIAIVKFPTSPTEAVYDMVDSLPTCNGKASRTRCMSLDALIVQMEWYSTHKFSDSNCTYIERNQWNDSMADFDPRVFQAFVWADLPKPKQ